MGWSLHRSRNYNGLFETNSAERWFLEVDVTPCFLYSRIKGKIDARYQERQVLGLLLNPVKEGYRLVTLPFDRKTNKRLTNNDSSHARLEQ